MIEQLISPKIFVTYHELMFKGSTTQFKTFSYAISLSPKRFFSSSCLVVNPSICFSNSAAFLSTNMPSSTASLCTSVKVMYRGSPLSNSALACCKTQYLGVRTSGKLHSNSQMCTSKNTQLPSVSSILAELSRDLLHLRRRYFSPSSHKVSATC